MHWTLAILATLASATLYGTPYPPLSWEWTSWLLLVPLFWALQRSSTRTSLWCAALWGITAAYASADALPWTTAHYYDQPLWIGFGFFVPMAAVTTSTVMVPFALALRSFRSYGAHVRPLLAGAAWVAYELLRARVLGNPWADLGYGLVGHETLVQIADVAGVFGPSFLAAAANAAVLELLLAGRGRDLRHAVVGAVLVAGCIAGVAAYGHMRLSAVVGGVERAPAEAGEPLQQGETADAATSILIVQGNVDLGSQWRDELYGKTLDTYVSMTTEALRERSAAIVVWPENAMTFFVEREALYRAALADMLSVRGAQLIAGGPRTTDDSPGGAKTPAPTAYYNSAFLLSPEGQVLGHYDKRQLLPFAEYFPVPALDFLRRDFGEVREFTRGTGARMLETAGGKAGVVICNESLYAETVARRVADGAEYVVNLTNDGWLADEKLSGVAFAMTRLRAVEQRRYVVRASTSGPSAVIDPFGRVVAKTGPIERATVAAVIVAREDFTIYARIGDGFAVLCLLLTALASLAAARVQRDAAITSPE